MSESERLVFDDQGSGRPVLFIHGHPFDRTMWAPQIGALRDRYRAIAPDLRGYGLSKAEPQQSVTQEQFANDLIGLLDRLEVDRACVVGLSMGGQIAMEFGRRFPARVAGLALAATFPQAETPDGIVARNLMADRVVAEGMALTGCEMLPRLIGASSMKRSPDVAANVYRMICGTNPAAAAAALRGRAMREDYRESLTAFAFPCLIVVGAEDSYSSIAEAEAMRDAIQDSRLEIFPEIGHLPNLEDAEKFNRVLKEFLDRVFATTPNA
jgi:3-oxoadipate enol-lactonase